MLLVELLECSLLAGSHYGRLRHSLQLFRHWPRVRRTNELGEAELLCWYGRLELEWLSLPRNHRLHLDRADDVGRLAQAGGEARGQHIHLPLGRDAVLRRLDLLNLAEGELLSIVLHNYAHSEFEVRLSFIFVVALVVPLRTFAVRLGGCSVRHRRLHIVSIAAEDKRRDRADADEVLLLLSRAIE